MAQTNLSCERCGAPLLPDARYCNRCGQSVDADPYAPLEEYSPRSGLIALLLCIFLGALGIHRFYAGRIVTGILWLLTGGLFGIGWIIDLILIVMSRFRDADGRRILLTE